MVSGFFLEPMLGDDRVPYRLHAGHLLFERLAMAGIGGGRNAEMGGELRPKPAPAEDFAIDDVEGLVAGGWLGRGPEQVLGDDPAIGDIDRRFILLRRARKDEGPAGFPADRGIGAERCGHVHLVADRIPDQRMRTMDRPAEALAFGGCEDLVFLVIVEILVGEARLLFAERCDRLSLCIGLEGSHVMLETGDQRDMANGLAFHRAQEIAHHAGVDAAVFCFRRLAQPGRDEDVGGMNVCQRLHDGDGVGQVHGDMSDARRQVVLVTGKAGDSPAFGHKPFRQMAADNAGYAGDECMPCHQLRPPVLSVILMQA